MPDDESEVVEERIAWDDIEEHLIEKIGLPPQHYGTTIKWALGGPDPLDGSNVYMCDEPTPHWMYVGFGCSELYEKESEDNTWSGYGFEFTFRLERGEETDPPTWPFGLMNNLARYVFETGNCFGPGHRMDLNCPILQGTNSDLTCVLFALDPVLGTVDTMNGKVEFLQIVGATEDENRAAEAWNSKRFLDLLEQSNPHFICQLDRKSILRHPEVAQQVTDGIEREGSSCDSLHLVDVDVSVLKDRLQLTILSSFVDSVKNLIAGRLKHNKELRLHMDGTNVYLEPGDKNEWTKTDDDEFVVTMTPALVQEILDKMSGDDGTYRFDQFPNFLIAAKEKAVV